MNQHNDIDKIFTSPWAWLEDMFYAAIDLAKWFVLIALIGVTAGCVLMKAGYV